MSINIACKEHLPAHSLSKQCDLDCHTLVFIPNGWKCDQIQTSDIAAEAMLLQHVCSMQRVLQYFFQNENALNLPTHTQNIFIS